ncbi:MAG: TRAP transporter substrate-binding protein [Desulfobacteraceae bacterium]|nr:TRAP transporter substrate-binding protein [Desulfobacteraceae bacterium]
MRAKRFSVLLALAVAFAFGLGVFAASSAEAAKTIRVATVALPETTIYQGLDKWQKIMAEKSKGAIEIKILGRAVMGGDREMIEGCRLGTLDAGIVSGSVLANILPQFSMTALPYLFNSHEEANAYLDGPMGQKLFALLEEKDLVGLGWSSWSFRGIWNNVRPIAKPEDMNGLKIRTVETPLDMGIVNKMGGVATPMAWSECLLGLRQGTVDGISTTYGLGYPLKLYEIAKFASQTNQYYETAPLIMGKKLFSSFTPEEQKLIKETAAEAMLSTRIEQMKYEQGVQPLLEAKGVKVNSISKEVFEAFREKTKPLYDEFRPKVTPELMDASMAFLKAYREKK